MIWGVQSARFPKNRKQAPSPPLIMIYYLRLCLLAGWFYPLLLAGQVSEAVWPDSGVWQVQRISISGLKHTKEAVVRRELPFEEGDTIAGSQLANKLKEGQLQLMNTGLFRKAEITPLPSSEGSQSLSFEISLKEGWYVFPVPIFELADRNFNVWWVEQERSLERINVGLEFTHENFTGWRDRFKIGFKYGYTRSFNLGYRFPYLNRARTLGMSLDVSLARNRELNYATLADKQLFYKDESTFVYRRARFGAGLTYRRRLYTTHQLLATYYYNQVDERVALELNPNFLGEGRSKQRYLSLVYSFTHDKRDIRPYPWSGYLLAGALEVDGLGIFPDRNDITWTTRTEKYLPFSDRWSMGVQARTKLSLIRQRQPYNDNRALGFGGSYVFGYEYYIIDGLDLALVKSSLRGRLFDKSINLGRLMPLDNLKKIPTRLYASFNAGWGFVNAPFAEPGNTLNNRSLWGGGVGLDLVFFYDTVLQIQYSYNDLGEGGFFLHFNFGI